MQSLKDHLRDRHDSFLCDICLENKKVFLGEQTLYSKVGFRLIDWLGWWVGG